MKANKRLSKAEMLDRMPRAFRPRLKAPQLRDLALCHIVNLDAIARGDAGVDMLWDWVGGAYLWSRAAELIGQGENEMAEQLELCLRLIERWQRSGRVLFSGPDYQLAKKGVDVMDQLATLVDEPTAHKAACWSSLMLDAIKAKSRRLHATAASGERSESSV